MPHRLPLAAGSPSPNEGLRCVIPAILVILLAVANDGVEAVALHPGKVRMESRSRAPPTLYSSARLALTTNPIKLTWCTVRGPAIRALRIFPGF